MRCLLFIFSLLYFSVYSQYPSTELLESLSPAEIAEIANDNGVPNGIVDIGYGVDFYRVLYQTVNLDGDSVVVSGGLAVPSGQCQFPMAVYQHGTVAERDDVPSQLNDEAAVAILFGSAGFVAIAPDLLGLGVSEEIHPYVHADSEAWVASDMIKNVEALQDDLEFNWNEQIFILGYSQGGHGAMALHQHLQEANNPDFEVTASAPMSGPYDMSGAQSEPLLTEIPYSSPAYFPYLIRSYNEAYGLYDDLSEYFIEPYASLIPDLYNGENGMGYINNFLPPLPLTMMQPDVLANFLINPFHPLRLALQDNDTYNWTPEAPLHMFYCTEDEQVFFENALVAYDDFIANGATQIEISNGGPFTHSQCADLAILGGYTWFQQFIEDPFPVVPEFETTAESFPGANDGIISVSIDGNEDDYIFSWSNGDAGTSAFNLSAGSYWLNIAEDNGCNRSYEVILDSSTEINDLDISELLQIYQIGSQYEVIWKSNTNAQLDLFTVEGKLFESLVLQPFEISRIQVESQFLIYNFRTGNYSSSGKLFIP